MTRGTRMRKPDYDVVVVGSGLGGLTAAALLSKEGRKVLVVEKEDNTGGFAAGTSWNGRQFDTAIHLIMGGGTPIGTGEGLVRAVLEHLEVSDRCELMPVAPFYRAIFPDFEITVPTGRAKFLAAHRDCFPAKAEALEKLMELAAALQEEMLRFPVAPLWWQKLSVPRRFPKLLRNLPLTLERALTRYDFDDRAKAVLGALWPYLGLPPSRVSFPVWSVMTASYVDEGAYYCRGGFQRLVDAFHEAVRKTGGELLTGKTVRRILVEQGSVRGVILEGGDEISAGTVISNIDARTTARSLLGEAHLPAKYRRKIARMEPSVYAAVLYLPVDRAAVPAGAVHETLKYETWEHDEAFALSLAGQISGVTVTIPTLADPSLAPPEEHLVVVSGVVPSQAERFPEDTARQLAHRAEPVVPGLRDYVESASKTTAAMEERFRLHRLGPIYGWARSPRQIGPRGLENTTPISGLYSCGHWSQPGAGIRTVVISGIRVARLVTGQKTSEGVLSFVRDHARSGRRAALAS